MRATSARRRVAAALLCCLSGAAAAHERSVSYSTWTLGPDGAEVRLRLPLPELNRIGLDPHAPETPERLAAQLREGFVLEAAQGSCRADRAQVQLGSDSARLEGRWQCPGPPLRLESRFLLAAVPGHVHLLQLRASSGRLLGPWALTAASPALDWQREQAPAQTLPRYLLLGGIHILSGWDHLAYLVVVLLGAATLGQLAWRITGFTLGHSLTLALASFGWVRPQASLVEAFIALTIAATAAERVLAPTRRGALHAAAIATLLAAGGVIAGVLPPLLALATALLSAGAASAPQSRIDAVRTAMFGLFHGFGFAGVLLGLGAGGVAVLPLLGFNLGVELGQLLFVLPLWMLLRRAPPATGRLLAALVLALGSAAYFMRLAG